MMMMMIGGGGYISVFYKAFKTSAKPDENSTENN